MSLKIIVNDREYKSWNILDVKDFVGINLIIQPLKEKLLNNDIFDFNENKCILIQSSLRKNTFIPGVLLLEDNKTYGKINNKLLYKCIPDDCRIPIFLIPFEIKKLDFSKKIFNLYITFEFFNWDDKHPIGKVTQNLGSVIELKNFYEYQLYCKSLHESIKILNKVTLNSINEKKMKTNDLLKDISQLYNIYDERTIENGWDIFSIDPVNSLDFDDAFSIRHENDYLRLSIYISNVPIWIDYLDLWESLSKRISTIYLPDKKRPMLPSILSDNLCSLCKNEKRIAFCLDIIIKNNNIEKIEFLNFVIKVNNNFSYEENKLETYKSYYLLFQTCQKIIKVKDYSFCKKINDSHDLVSYLMLLMNNVSAKNLFSFKNGIFRSTSFSPNILSSSANLPLDLPDELNSFLLYWHNTSGLYHVLTDNPLDIRQDISHKMLQMEQYVHISSPIRRIVDLLNMIQFFKNQNILILTEKSNKFYQSWISKIDYINISTRSIRKIQSDCQLLQVTFMNSSILEKKYIGYSLDKIRRSDGLYQFIIYLPELKLTSRLIIREELENYQVNKYQLYLFKNENNLKKKIRIQLCK